MEDGDVSLEMWTSVTRWCRAKGFKQAFQNLQVPQWAEDSSPRGGLEEAAEDTPRLGRSSSTGS